MNLYLHFTTRSMTSYVLESIACIEYDALYVALYSLILRQCHVHLIRVHRSE